MQRFEGFSAEYEDFAYRKYQDHNYCGPPPSTPCCLAQFDRFYRTHWKNRIGRYLAKIPHIYKGMVARDRQSFPAAKTLQRYRNVNPYPGFKPTLEVSGGYWVGEMPDGTRRILGLSGCIRREDAEQSYYRKLRYAHYRSEEMDRQSDNVRVELAVEELKNDFIRVLTKKTDTVKGCDIYGKAKPVQASNPVRATVSGRNLTVGEMNGF